MSNNLNTTKIPGMIYPTQQAMLAGSPQDSAIANSNLANMKLTKLQSVGGRRYRKNIKRGGNNGGRIVVPQFNDLYKPIGGPGQTTNDIIKQNAGIGTQSAENSQFDKLALQKGGDVYINPDTNKYQWGCYSGGKKYKMLRKSRKSRKLRKSRKIKRTRIHKKTSTSRKSRKSRKSKKH
jgi:hypothetical protein